MGAGRRAPPLAVAAAAVCCRRMRPQPLAAPLPPPPPVLAGAGAAQPGGEQHPAGAEPAALREPAPPRPLPELHRPGGAALVAQARRVPLARGGGGAGGGGLAARGSQAMRVLLRQGTVLPHHVRWSGQQAPHPPPSAATSRHSLGAAVVPQPARERAAGGAEPAGQPVLPLGGLPTVCAGHAAAPAAPGRREGGAVTGWCGRAGRSCPDKQMQLPAPAGSQASSRPPLSQLPACLACRVRCRCGRPSVSRRRSSCRRWRRGCGRSWRLKASTLTLRRRCGGLFNSCRQSVPSASSMAWPSVPVVPSWPALRPADPSQLLPPAACRCRVARSNTWHAAPARPLAPAGGRRQPAGCRGD